MCLLKKYWVFSKVLALENNPGFSLGYSSRNVKGFSPGLNLPGLKPLITLHKNPQAKAWGYS